MPNAYVARKFEGDDQYSWAVFRTADVKHLRGVVFSHQATPICCGEDRLSAQRIAQRMSVSEKLKVHNG